MSRPRKSKIDAALDAYYLLDDDERTSFDVIRKRVDARLGPQVMPPQRDRTATAGKRKAKTQPEVPSV